jgi:hypothetical protein
VSGILESVNSEEASTSILLLHCLSSKLKNYSRLYLDIVIAADVDATA